MASSPITFSGSSTFASSFQQVIQRAVRIASLPIQGLASAVSTLNSKQSALLGLTANFNALQSSVQVLDTARSGKPSAQLSDSTSITANAAAGALTGNYVIQVDDPGSSSSSLSKAGLTTVTDPATKSFSTASSFKLTFNGAATTITPSENSFSALAAGINASGVGVQATIINIGSSSSPDYRLSLVSNDLGADSIQLSDGTQDLLDPLTTGAPAQYRLNNSATEIQSNSRQITLSPGLTVNLLTKSSAPVTIKVSQDFSGLQSAIGNFVSAYNAAFDALAQNRGKNGGALTGDSTVLTATNLLQQIAQFTSSSGKVGSLADVGVTLDSTGHLNVDSSLLQNAPPAALTGFLGDIKSGGFLKTANDQLQSMTDTSTGLFPTETNSIAARITADNTQISKEQDRVSQLQANLEAQLSKADAVIAGLQAQKNYFTQLFQAQYGNNTNGNG